MKVRNADILIFEDIELGDRRPALRDVRSGPTVEEDGKEQGPACNERLAGSHPLLDVQLFDQTRQVCALDTVEPEEEVFTEGSGFDSLQEVLVSGRDHPDVHLDRPRASYAIELPVLEKAQELGLKAWLHVADLVQEDCPTVRDLELAALLSGSPCESPFLVAEQFRLQELFRKGHAVHRHEQSAATCAPIVDRPGQEIL